MGFLDRLLGRETPRQPQYAPQPYAPQPYAPQPTDARAPAGPADPDQVAIERYRYLLRTAPPDALEQAHAEAFAQLTPEQRRQVLDGLAAEVPPGERAADDDPRSLARMATRAELRQPGTLERTFGRPGSGGGTGGMGGGMGGGIGMGGMIAGSLLASVAGAFVGTAIADSLLDLSDGGGDAAADGGGDAGADAGADAGGDVSADGGGWGDSGGYDGGGFGGDFGGGGFGGDFGGGDF